MDIRTILPIVLLSLSCASANVMANGTRVFEAKYDPLAEESPEVSPYAYCRNNFVNRIDPDGKDILIWFKDCEGKDKIFRFRGFQGQKSIKVPNNPFILDFIMAYTFNKKNGGGRSTIEIASNPEIEVFLSESNQNRNHYQSGRQPTVFWVPRKALQTSDGGKQSPATALEHKMDHALGDLTASEHNNYRKRKELYDVQYDNAKEKKVIEGREAETAKSNNESIRKDHKGTLFMTESPISTLKIK